MNNNEFNRLGLMANIFQVADFWLNISQVNNDMLLKKLQEQDKVLDEQTNVYLKTIIEQNKKIINQGEEIISLLKNGTIAKR